MIWGHPYVTIFFATMLIWEPFLPPLPNCSFCVVPEFTLFSVLKIYTLTYTYILLATSQTSDLSWVTVEKSPTELTKPIDN